MMSVLEPLEGDDVRESWSSRLAKWRMNLYPAYRRTGARVDRVSSDFRYVRIRLPLNRQTRNLNESLFGGCLYAAVDPIHTVMLLQEFDPEKVVIWVKDARIWFRKPGRSTLYGHFRLEEELLEKIHQALREKGRVNEVFAATLVDREGEVHVECSVTLHIRSRDGLALTERSKGESIAS